MAVTTYATEYSTQVAKHDLPATYFPGNPPRQPEDEGHVHYLRFDFTQGAAAGDATSTQGLCYLPAGRWRILGAFIDTSAFGASRTLDIGWDAFTQHDGTAVVADPNGLVAAKDVSAALVAWGLNVATAHVVLESRADVLIYSTVAGGTIPAGATIKGVLLVGKAE